MDFISGDMTYIVLEAIFLGFIFIICGLHWFWFSKNWPTGKFFHAIFAALYAYPVFHVGWLWNHSILLIICLCLLRFFAYNPTLNLMRDKPFFYLSVNSKDPSWWDSVEIKWAKWYPAVWGASGIWLFILQFFLKK